MLARGGRLARNEPPGVVPPFTSEVLFLAVGPGVYIDEAVPGRETPAGGCGKELMLIVFRTVLSDGLAVDLLREEVDLKVGTVGVEEEAYCVTGRADGRGVEGDRSLGGLGESLMISDGFERTGKLFLGGLAVGIGGKADFGGSMTGRDG